MNRVETALRQNNCVLIAGSDFLARGLHAELSQIPAPSAALQAETESALPIVSAETFATLSNGGLVVIIEPDVNADAAGLDALHEAMAASGHKLRVMVAAKFFNRSGFPLQLRLLNLQHLKSRGDHMVKQLVRKFSATQAASTSSLSGLSAALFGGGASATPAPKSNVPKIEAPRPEFIGRTDELAQLKAMLSDAGPAIVVHGPSGIGKRWLVQRALVDMELKIIPSLQLGFGFGADALMGRIAIAAREAGHDQLSRALQPNKPKKGMPGRKRPSPKKLVGMVIEALKLPELSNHLLIVSGVEQTLDRDSGSFYHEGMLELLLNAMLSTNLSVKMILLSALKPQLYQNEDLRHVGLSGLNNSLMPQIFEAWHVGEKVSTSAEALHQQTHGHPLALRHIAISARENREISALDESNDDTLIDTIDDIKGLRKLLRVCEQSLDSVSRKVLYQLALLDFPADHSVLRAFDVNRRVRSALLAAGVLEQTPDQGRERLYYVHPLVRRILPYRKLYDFDTMKFVGKTLQDLAKGARSSGEHLKSFCYIQSANVLFQSARSHRDCWNLDVMFVDPLVSTINEILGRPAPKGERSAEIREKNQRAIRAQLDAALSECPNHPDALYSTIRQLQQLRADNDNFLGLFKRIRESAATPDSFHREASFFRNKRVLTEVSSVLGAGIKQFPKSATLHRRLADTQFRLGEAASAEASLTKAVKLQPTMPENFSLLGKLLFHQGQEHWDKAQEAFQMARSLGPANAVLLVREAELLRAQGLAAADLASGTPLFIEAQAKLDSAIELDRSYHSARVTKAKIQLDILDKRGDTATEEELEAIKALLRPALKRKDSADAYIQQARLLIQLNTVDDIERLLDKAYKIEKNRHELYYVRGILYFKQENPDRAKQSFETALLHTPKSAPEYGVYEAAAAQMLEMIKTGKFTSAPVEPSTTPSDDDQGFRTEATVKVRKRKQVSEAPTEQSSETASASSEDNDASTDHT